MVRHVEATNLNDGVVDDKKMSGLERVTEFPGDEEDGHRKYGCADV